MLANSSKLELKSYMIEKNVIADAHIAVGVGYFLRIPQPVKSIPRDENKNVVVLS